jgi:hypothetical protein
MPNLLTWMAGVESAFVGFGLLASSCLPLERRTHFWGRVMLCLAAMLALALLVGEALMLGLLVDHVFGLVWLLLAISALLVGPAFCYRRTTTHGSESDGGGGSSPKQPPPPPSRPSGGIPLEDAEQARVRVRDHDRPSFARPSERRPAREPGPAPVRRLG